MSGSPSPRNRFRGDFAGTLRLRHHIMQHIRGFFDSRGYLEVETPLRVPCPCIDAHIDAIPAGPSLYLLTSPEFHMKRLLRLGIPRMYQIARCFRDGESGRHHSTEFTMLEWYRTGTDCLGIMEETEQLVASLAGAVDGRKKFAFRGPLRRVPVSQLYLENAGWDPCSSWDEDRYFRDWAETIEPRLAGLGAFFLTDFPAPLAALSKLNAANPRTCERAELFIDGLEIGNAYSELTDHGEHLGRFEQAAASRTAMGKRPYPPDDGFLEAVELGLPECGGIAVGVDRLIMTLAGVDRIDHVLAFPAERL